MYLEWFTHSITRDGEQKIHIRPLNGPGCLDPQNIVVLDLVASRTMHEELNRAAIDLNCDFSDQKQRTLAQFYEAFRAQTVKAV